MHFRSGEWHSELVFDNGAGDGTMARLISDYIAQGLLPLSTSMRSLAVPQCREVALKDPKKTILIVSKPDYRSYLSRKLELARPTQQKRMATEPLHHERPHKTRTLVPISEGEGSQVPQHEEKQLEVIRLPMKRPADEALRGHRRKWQMWEI